MTKQEAIEAMKNGEKVTHKWFTPDEWVEDHEMGYRFEDGCLCSVTDFWAFRNDESWEDGWSIFNG